MQLKHNEGWISNITTVKIPWKHAGGDKAEIIYDNEQKLPEIKTTLKFLNKTRKSRRTLDEPRITRVDSIFRS
jgi:hypothetical protein